MSEVETRLARLRHSADATVFADIAVSSELKTRVYRAVTEGASAHTADAPRRPSARAGRRHSGLFAALGLAAAAAGVALATLVAYELWPGGDVGAASLTVKVAGSPFVVSVTDPHVRAGREGFVTLRGGELEVHRIEIDSANSLSYRWSPDGRRLAYGNRGDLFVYDAETGETRNITRTPKRWELLPAWSPDGSRLAFTSRRLEPGEGPQPEAPGDPEWLLVGVSGGSPTVAGSDGAGYRVLDSVTITSSPSWSPDGRRVAYATDGIVDADLPDTRANRADAVISVADVVSGHVQRLTLLLGRGAGYMGSPSWSPTRDELALFFSQSDRAPSRQEVISNTAPRVQQGYALLDLESGAVSVAYSYKAPFVPRGQASWSDDGELLALNFRQETAIADPAEVVLVTRGGRVKLRVPGGLFSFLAWEPGEHRLAVRDDSDAAGVLLVSLGEDGADVTMLRFDSELEGFAWRPTR